MCLDVSAAVRGKATVDHGGHVISRKMRVHYLVCARDESK
jgi:hypothetical protein